MSPSTPVQVWLQAVDEQGRPIGDAIMVRFGPASAGVSKAEPIRLAGPDGMVRVQAMVRARG